MANEKAQERLFQCWTFLGFDRNTAEVQMYCLNQSIRGYGMIQQYCD